MYFTDRGIEELEDRRGEEEVSLAWLADRLRAFVDAHRRRADNTATAIVRLEKLYPVPRRRLGVILDRYPHATDIRWVQEEAANQGAWPFLGLWLPERMNGRLPHLKRVSRRRMAAPAAGVAKVHEVEQKALIAEALAD